MIRMGHADRRREKELRRRQQQLEDECRIQQSSLKQLCGRLLKHFWSKTDERELPYDPNGIMLTTGMIEFQASLNIDEVEGRTRKLSRSTRSR